jgi:multidrug efflux pump subunit AcrA (membrane-fusion protein)
MGSDVDLKQLTLSRKPGAATPRRHLWTRYIIPIMLLSGFFGLGIWGAGDVLFPRTPVSVVPVRTTRVQGQREGTALFSSAGWIEPRPTAIRVAALAPGVVERLLVVEDQQVAEGEPVAELIREDAALALDHANANLALRIAERKESQAIYDAAVTRLERPLHLMAALGESEAAVAQLERQLQEVPFELRRATADLDFAKRNYEGKTAASDVISQRSIQHARTEMESAQATLEGVRSRRTSLQRERDALALRRDSLQEQLERKTDETRAKRETESRLEAADALVEQARIKVEEARLQLERMTVRAPISGRILALVAQPGSRLAEGRGHSASHDASTVVTMYQPESLQVRVDVRFEDIRQVALGQSVQIENRATPEPLTGHVLFVSSEADIQKNTLQVKVALEASPDVFKPEMLVDVTFLAPASNEPDDVAQRPLRILVPTHFMHTGAEGSFLWMADQSEQLARQVWVETGKDHGDGFTEVASGLDLTARLIATPHDHLKEGMRIRVVGEKALNESE